MDYSGGILQRTARVPYRCDTDALILAIRKAFHDFFAATAREPCAVRLHPADRSALRRLPVEYGLATWPGQVDRLLNMIVIEDDNMQPGEARIERCRASHRDALECEHAEDPGGQEAARQRRGFYMQKAVERLFVPMPIPPAVASDGGLGTYRQRPNEIHTEYGPKPEVVQAVRWVGGNLDQMIEFGGDGTSGSRHSDGVLLPRPDGHGFILVPLGQWAVRTGLDAIYVMADWAFSEDYYRAPDKLGNAR